MDTPPGPDAYNRRMNPSPNLILVGPMGAGKSSIGQALARRFALRFVQFFERVSRQALRTLPGIAERTIRLDAQRQPLG